MKKLLWFWLCMLLGTTACGTTYRVETTPLAPLEASWGDRAGYMSGLVSSEQTTLADVPGASTYHLDLRIADDFLSLSGTEQVRYTNQEPVALDAVYFQLFPNMEGGVSSLSKVSVDGKPAFFDIVYDSSSARVKLDSPLNPGNSVVVQMDFNVSVPAKAGGNYGLFGYLDHILVLDGFYPAIPVYDAAGWHAGPLQANADTTFQDASYYEVRVTAPKTLVLAASGVEINRSQVDGLQTVTYTAGPARDFYLAGSENWLVISQSSGETRVNVYASVDQKDGAQAALRTAINALRTFSSRLRAYPYTEYDVIAVPLSGAYGIEYPGIVGINQSLFDLKQDGVGGPVSRDLEATVAHETGHQWFYNLVGNDQQNDPWLDESLTQYLTGTYYQDLYGPGGFADYRQSWFGRWNRVNQKTIPIGRSAADYIGKEYGAIVYGRGPLFVEALAAEIGQPVFDAFLRDYFKTYHWGIATPHGFRQMAEVHCSCDLGPLFAEWVDTQS